MSKLLLVLLSTCAIQCSAQDEVNTRFQVETADGIAGIIEKLAPIRQAILHFKAQQDFLKEWIMKATVDFNKTLETLDKTRETLVQRQAVSSALQIFQFILVIVYFLTIAIIAICKCVKKNSLEQQEVKMELIEQKLQERREQCKSAARHTAAKATPQ